MSEWRTPLPCTASAWSKIGAAMDALFALLPIAEKKPIDQEGLDVITSMLVVGCIFLAVIAVGQLGRWLSHRKRPH